jgi:hypothetical protein
MIFPVCALCSNTLGPQGQDLVAQLKLRLKVMLHEARHPELLAKVMRSAHRQTTGGAAAATADSSYDSDSPSSSECGDDCDDGASLASELTVATVVQHKQHSPAAAAATNAATAATAAAAAAVAVAAPLQRQALSTQDQFRAGGGAGMQRAPQRKASAGGPVFANGFQRTAPATSLPAQPVLSLTRQLRVCTVFAGGEQCVSTCPLAHPGVQDAAVVRSAAVQPRQQQQQQQQQRSVRAVDSGASSSSSAQCVIVCEAALLAMLGQGSGCSEGMSCRQYHPYVRPSTQQLIDKIYQK